MSYNHKGVSIYLNYCYTTYPCMHTCTIDDGPLKLMSATEIIDMLRERCAPIPGHFAQYKTQPDPIDPDANPICVRRYLAFFDETTQLHHM
jgi:hypothetical protein